MSHSERPAATRRPMQQQHSGGGSPPLGEVFSMDEDHSSVSGKEKDLDRQSEQLRAVALFDDRESASRRYDRFGRVVLAAQEHLPWWRRRQMVVEACATLAGLVFVLIGLLLQLLMKESHAFRWLYFFAALPFLWWAVSFVVRRIYVRIELAYFQELIYYWTSLRFSSTLLAFTLLALPVYQALFVWSWCSKRTCTDPTFVKASNITWNVCLCVVLFSLANFLKSFGAKLISQHFYKTAHIAKVKQALQQEYYLLSLSKQRPEPSAHAAFTQPITKMSAGLSHLSMKPAGSIQPPGAGPSPAALRTKSGHEVALHQQVEALTLEATSPHLTQQCSSAKSATSSGPSLLGSVSNLPIPRVESQRPWFWQAILDRRRHQSQAAAAATAAASAPDLGIRIGGGGAGRSAFSYATTPPQRGPSQLDVGGGGDAPPHAPHSRARLDSAAVALTEVRVDAGGLDDVAEGDVELTSPPAEAQPLCDQQQQHRQQQREQHEQQHQREQQRQRDAAARAAAASPAPESVADGAGARGGEQGAEASRAANAVAAKTFSALVRKYAALSEEEEAAQLKLAGKFGKGLFENCRRDPRAPGVTLEDFLPFFPDDTAAAQAFDFFDKDGDGFISKAEMKEAVTAIVAERRDMATSLRDTDSIVASLEAFLAGLVHLTFIAFYLLVWDINVMSGFSTFSATVLALTFVFGESVKNVFQSAVWLFGNHALDVGDTIMMPPDDTWHRVKKFGLVDTVLVRENGDLVHVPNNKLWTAPIVNLTRSGRRTDITRILIDTDAPSKARDVLRDALVAHCAGPGKGDFVGEPRVRFSGLTPEGKSRLSISWTYTFGATDARYAVVRDSILAVMKDALGGFGAMHTLPVRSMPQHHKSD